VLIGPCTGVAGSYVGAADYFTEKLPSFELSSTYTRRFQGFVQEWNSSKKCNTNSRVFKGFQIDHESKDSQNSKSTRSKTSKKCTKLKIGGKEFGKDFFPYV
jgi:hypothetical protein